jgi:lysophospholipase L1-like esterase
VGRVFLNAIQIGATCLLLGVLGGCGGGEPSPDEPRLGGEQNGATNPLPEAERGTVVAALGDSITAGSPLWDPDEAVLAQIGSSADPESQYEHWVQRRTPEAKFRNCGVFGERTDEIAARLDRCAKGADILIVQGGINDIAQMRRVRTAARNLRVMVVRGKELGLRVALVEVLPWNNGGAMAAPRIRRLNRLIAGIGTAERVPVFPWYEQLEDPNAPGQMKREWTIDGDHPSIEGYRRLADVVELP